MLGFVLGVGGRVSSKIDFYIYRVDICKRVIDSDKWIVE